MNNILNEIEKQLEISKSTEEEHCQLERKLLNNILEIALKGVKFNKLRSLEGANPYGETEIAYLKDSNGSDVKGIHVQSFKLLNENYDDYNIVSLILTDNGKFHVIKRNNTYREHDGSISRRILREDIDVLKDIPVPNDEWFNYSKYNENAWSTDEISDNIEYAMNKRLDKLKERNKTQQERIKKIQTLNLK